MFFSRRKWRASEEKKKEVSDEFCPRLRSQIEGFALLVSAAFATSIVSPFYQVDPPGRAAREGSCEESARRAAPAPKKG